jgi:pyruvate dehydrogenase (quinone)
MEKIASEVLIARLSDWGVDTIFAIPGYPEHGVRFGTRSPDYAAWGRTDGGYGVHVDKPGDLHGALSEASAVDGSALVDVAVDSNEPPMPGKVKYEQAKQFARAYLRGQPHKVANATTLFKDKLEQFRGK